MPISWNEIKERALAFSTEWKDETNEHAEAKSFWDGFFNVFGVKRRSVAAFEARVKKFDKESYGFIDLFWPGVMLVEHKSRGLDLGKAETQAFEYILSLQNEGRAHEAPQYIVVSDFARICLHDLENDETSEFLLDDLHKHVHEFAFIAGYRTAKLVEESPVNIKAAEVMAGLHDALDEGGYQGEDLEKLLTRILFCLFAEDTGIFEPNTFADFIENRTAEDGSDLGIKLAQFFDVLNTPEDKRQRNLDETLQEFPYVNGALFADRLRFAAFNRKMREQLLHCAYFDWSAISPAIFGSMFQGVMDSKERRQIGAHYTSERDIMKVLNSLFLDNLRREFIDACKLKTPKTRKERLQALHTKIARMKLFDPACGCGNFGHVLPKGQFFWRSRIILRSCLGILTEELSSAKKRYDARDKRNTMETAIGGIVLREPIMSR